ncbi:E3 ubiquitin-protein ligase Mdm2-like isoform X2 [Gigantopelta aegis]|nr:E3 ubiquitin-protein ligase Mdm2-like isoform X2 [Gigantopelta aegis]
MSDGGQGLSSMDGTSMGEQTPGGTVLLDTHSLMCTDPATTTTPSTRQQYVVEEEITVSVPLVRPKQDFLFILKQAGARGEVFTRKEICYFLKNYIGSRKLYDPNDPRVVYCKEDILGKVFGVENFTINDVLCLLSKNCTPVPDTCIKRKRHVVSRSVSTSSQTTGIPDQKPLPTRAAICPVTTEVIKGPPSDVITSTTSRITSSNSLGSGTSQSRTCDDDPAHSDKKRKQDGTSTDSTDVDLPVKKCKTSLNVTYSDSEAACYPWYFSVKMEKSDESEILSVQDKETMLVKDSTDDLWFVEEDEISVEYESDAFSVEYEVESSPSDTVSDTDGTCDMSGDGFLVVCNDSDVPFWASSEMDSESDSELSDADKWTCGECEEKNSPVQRYCSRCWKLRPDWLPEFHARKPMAAGLSRKRFVRSHSAPGAISSPESTTSDSSRTNRSPVRDRSPQRAKRLAKRSAHQDTTSPSQPSSSCSSSFLCNNKTHKKKYFSPDEACLSVSTDLKKGSHGELCLSVSSGSRNKESDEKGFLESSDFKKTFPDDACLSISSDSKNISPADETCLLVSSECKEFLPDEMCPSVSQNLRETCPVSEKSELNQQKLKGFSSSPTSSSANAKRLPFLDDSGVSVGSVSSLPVSSQESLRSVPLMVSSQESLRSVPLMVSSQESQQFSPPHTSQKPEELNGNDKTSSLPTQEKTNKELSLQHLSSKGHKIDIERSGSASYVLLGTIKSSSVSQTPLEVMNSISVPDTASDGKNSASRKNTLTTNPSKKALLQSESKKLDDIISSTDSCKNNPVRLYVPSSPKKTSPVLGQASVSDMCMICLSRPKTGSIIHGSSGHQVCCYKCAKRLKRKGKCCPVCRRSIQKVVRNYIL